MIRKDEQGYGYSIVIRVKTKYVQLFVGANESRAINIGAGLNSRVLEWTNECSRVISSGAFEKCLAN